MINKKIAVLTSGWSVDYVLSVIEGMRRVCSRNNIDLYIFTCYKFAESSGEPNTTSFAIFDLINYEEYDGIVIMPNLFNDEELMNKYAKKILESKVPAVSVNHPLEGFHFINSENHEAVKNLILHLINEHDVKTFGYIGGPEFNPGSISHYKAFLEALDESNLKKEDAIFFSGNCDWTYNTAYEQAVKIFENKDKIPQGIVCINDGAAMAAINVAVSNGYSVPDDIKIIGFDEMTMARKIVPSITTISLNGDLMGEAAIELLLENPAELTTRVIKASTCMRQSCGCQQKITKEQIIYSQGYIKELDKEQRFASQLRHLEDRFIKHNTISSLCEDLQHYYEKRHFFEGPDFAICLDKEVLSNIRESITEDNIHYSFGPNMQTITNIENGVQAAQFSFETRQLIPSNMISNESSVYLFLPIFNQKYVHGYYVSKNFTNLLLNKGAYNWTRNIGTIIEKFRQTAIYRMMSEQLRILSTQDTLSGLMNRAGLDNYATKLFSMNNKTATKTQIIFIDINSMKTINDKYGHLQGDLAIKTVAESITGCTPAGYIAIRYGGDEFVVIGTPKTNFDFSAKISEHLNERVQRMTLPYKLSVSTGSKIFEPNEKPTLAEAIKEVDEMMYIKKMEFHNSHE